MFPSYRNHRCIYDGNTDRYKVKSSFHKHKPSIVHLYKLKDFNNEASIKNLKALLSKSFHEEKVPSEPLKKSVNVTLEKHAPIKTRYSRANQAPDKNKR